MTPRFIEYEQVIRCNYELCQIVNIPSKIINLNISQKMLITLAISEGSSKPALEPSLIAQTDRGCR